MSVPTEKKKEIKTKNRKNTGATIRRTQKVR